MGQRASVCGCGGACLYCVNVCVWISVTGFKLSVKVEFSSIPLRGDSLIPRPGPSLSSSECLLLLMCSLSHHAWMWVRDTAQCQGGPWLDTSQVCCRPDEKLRKRLDFSDILHQLWFLYAACVWGRSPRLSAQVQVYLSDCGAGAQVTVRVRRCGCGLEIPDLEACSDNSMNPVWCFFCGACFWAGMWSILFSPQTHTHTHLHVLHCETGCQQRVPPLPLSLTATVRSSRWGAIKPDNKHSPSIPVCWCCCCCWCRAGGSSSATLC